MYETPELVEQLWSACVSRSLGCRPVLAPTGWPIGPVAAFLFPSGPVTLVDALYDSPIAREALTSALADASLGVGDIEQVIVTHGHGDHYGCAAWIQEESGCPVYLHREDIARMDDWSDRASALRHLWLPLGVPTELVERWIASPDEEGPPKPDFTPLSGGEDFSVGEVILTCEHHRGHSAGHMWVVAESARTAFVGDYLLAHSGASAGLEIDHAHPTGRAQLQTPYEAGLTELVGRELTMILPGHGPPATDVAALAARRLASGERRTRRVRRALDDGPGSVVEISTRLYGDRVKSDPWGILSDTVGRLDQLAESSECVVERQSGVDIFRAE